MAPNTPEARRWARARFRTKHRKLSQHQVSRRFHSGWSCAEQQHSGIEPLGRVGDLRLAIRQASCPPSLSAARGSVRRHARLVKPVRQQPANHAAVDDIRLINGQRQCINTTFSGVPAIWPAGTPVGSNFKVYL